MPSILSRFRNRKSSASHSLTSPSSPAFQDTPPTRRSGDTPAKLTSASTPLLPRPVSADTPAPQVTTSASVEQDRPQLPTTSSNVDNPAPNPESLSWERSVALPTLPELSPNIGEFPMPPTFPTAPPFHHVTSVDRSDLATAAGSGPSRHPTVISQRVVPSMNVAAVGANANGSAIAEHSRPDVGTSDIPEPRSSLRAGSSAIAQSAGSASPSQPGISSRVGETISEQIPKHLPQSTRDPGTSSDDHIAQHLSQLSLEPTFDHAQQWSPPKLASLERQRADLVMKIAALPKASASSTMSPEGRQVFKAAGMEEKLGQKDTVEAHTRWMKPVVQEHIIRKEHTEYTTIIDREIHKYHIYPKIQPIADPNPILLEPRHRIFSAVDGQWHEVVGDAAAIAILGEDVFYHGKKEVRHTRNMALPGFDEANDGMTGEETFGYGGGTGRIMEREGTLGGMGDWREVGRHVA